MERKGGKSLGWGLVCGEICGAGGGWHIGDIAVLFQRMNVQGLCLFSARPPAEAHDQIKSQPRPPNGGPNKRDYKAQKYINRAYCSFERLPPWVVSEKMVHRQPGVDAYFCGGGGIWVGGC